MGKGLHGLLGGNRALVLFAIVAVVTGVFTVVPAAAASGSNTREISSSGTTSFSAPRIGGALLQDPEIASVGGDEGSGAAPAKVPTLPDRSHTSGKNGSGENAGESNREGSDIRLVRSFNGLNHFAQRFSNGGNQFSVEPPDQGLCVGNGFVLETVNDVMAVYNESGGILKGPVDLNTFYGYAAAINRSTGVRGPFVTDPSCYFDVATQRWFHAVLTLEVFPGNGRFTGANHLDLAVSKTSSPLGSWTIYKLPVQNDGTDGTPNHHCAPGPYPVTPTHPLACIGDYPHIGADAYGFYITTNEYDFFGPNYTAAQVYAFSKQALAANLASVSVTQFDTKDMVRGNQAGFTVWPAVAPNGKFGTGGNGTEFFMSSNAADEVNPTASGTSTSLIVWALTNTQSLQSAHPNLSLTNTVLRVNRYTVPPKSKQKVGPTPLRDCINDTTRQTPFGVGCWNLLFVAEPAHNEVMSVLDSHDTRMQQVTYAGGVLYGALDTALRIKGKTQAGLEWFAVRPSLKSDGGVRAQVVNQGYVGLAGTNLTYPALAVNEHGVGAMAFTLVGTNDFPSAAYAPFNASSGMGSIKVAAAGVGPDDGFTSYKAYVGDPPRTRWGDYGAAVVDGSKIWMASEYIAQSCTFDQWFANSTCGGTRSALANWGTRISAVSTDD